MVNKVVAKAVKVVAKKSGSKALEKKSVIRTENLISLFLELGR